MTYQELRKIYNKYISIKGDEALPVNSFNVASGLNLRLKNSVDCKKDYGNNKSPLNNCNAFYALYGGEFTIYHDENNPYKNFSVAHEVAHHILQHNTDGIIQHHDANLLAAIIVAPVELIKKHKIKSSTQLSEICKIPINAAEEYWNEIFPKDKINHSYQYIAAVVLIVIIFSIILLCGTLNNNHDGSDTLPDTQEPSEQMISSQDDLSPSETVFVTTGGKKYHKKNCFHIADRDNILGISIEEAAGAGYEACKDCF